MTTLANSGAGQITKPQTQGRRILTGEDEDDTLIPRIHIYQGLPEEREIYGEHKAGEFINTVSGEVVTAAPFIPIFGWVEYIKFRTPRGSGIEYKERDKSQVPPEDLAFDRTNGTPPACTKFINFCVLLEGETFPLTLSFKSTSLAAGKTLNSLEKMRGSKGPGLYSVEPTKTRNSKGTWLTPKIRPMGNPKPEHLAQAMEFMNSLSPETVQTNLDDAANDDSPDFNPNEA